jgi:MFS family permease
MWRLPRALLPIYGTTLVDTLGYTLMIPLLPAVVKEYHASDAMVGALLSVPALCSAVAAPVWGRLSDVLGRKPIIIAAQMLTMAGYLWQAGAHSLLSIFAARILSGCGGGSLGAVESYIADVTAPKQRELAYSVYGAVFGVAFIVGPVGVSALIGRGISFPFYVAAGLEAFNILFTALLLPSRMQRTTKPSSLAQTLRAAGNPGVRRVLIRQLLTIFAIVCFLANFPLYLHHVLEAGIAEIGWLLSFAGAVGGAVLTFVVSPLAARIGGRAVAQIGLFLSFLAYAALALVVDVPMFAAVLVVWAVGSSMVEPTLTAILSFRAKRGQRGAIMGLSDSVNSLAMIVGPSAGSAIVGLNARLLGVLPACAALAAFVLGRWSAGEKERA